MLFSFLLTFLFWDILTEFLSLLFSFNFCLPYLLNNSSNNISIDSLFCLADTNLKMALCFLAKFIPSFSFTFSSSYKSDLFPATPTIIFLPNMSVAKLYQKSKFSKLL